jgi:HPt (histidine-containing phosphotransfer) domain-containing protein
VGAGNQEYEKDVTRQFIDAIPRELSALEEAAKRNEFYVVREITHNLKTTVSVMGLDELLQPLLDKIEYGEDVENLDQSIEHVSNICQKAVQEAQDFLLSITK